MESPQSFVELYQGAFGHEMSPHKKIEDRDSFQQDLKLLIEQTMQLLVIYLKAQLNIFEDDGVSSEDRINVIINELSSKHRTYYCIHIFDKSNFVNRRYMFTSPDQVAALNFEEELEYLLQM